MTKREAEAFNAGIVALAEVAVRIADDLDRLPWRPCKEGAANALRGLADEGLMLLKPIGPGAVHPVEQSAERLRA